MIKFVAPAVLALSLGLAGSQAFAADPPKAKPPAAKPAAPAAPVAKPVDPKTAACEKAWKAEKKHSSKHGAFIKACVAKG